MPLPGFGLASITCVHDHRTKPTKPRTQRPRNQSPQAGTPDRPDSLRRATRTYRTSRSQLLLPRPLEEAVKLARSLEQSALFWFDGEAFWVIPVLAAGEALRLPCGAEHGTSRTG